MDQLEAGSPLAERDSAAAGFEPSADQGAGVEPQAEDQHGSPDGEYEAPFNLADVPEEFRPDVERYVKQTRSDYTRKTMQLGEERRKIAELQSLDQRLADPESRDDALRELLSRYDLDLEIEGDDADDDELDDDGHQAEFDEEDMPEWARQLLERERQREESEQQEQLTRAQAEAKKRLSDHVGSALEGFREAAYKGQEKLPEDVHDALLGFGMILPAREDGLPDMEAAVAMLEGIEARAVDRFLATKRDIPPLPATRRGTSGTGKADLSSDTERIKRANAVAARHLESGAT